ncbi:MAG: right-handed parallel beta-helix repeat-containing protein [Bacteroidales bacterium]|nr:right-handed parallel beta-helix repeat-containing protein [Bacteroidales bacterium]
MGHNQIFKSLEVKFSFLGKVLGKLFLLLGLITFLFLQSCMNGDKIEYSGELKCDFEKITEDGKKIKSSIPEIEFSHIKTRTNEVSRSGDYSMKLSRKRQFGLSYDVNHAKTDDYYQITVWRKSKGNHGILVAASDVASKYYRVSKTTVAVDENGWEQLKLEVSIPPHLNNTKFKFYCWNPDTVPAYFDDLKIERFKDKNYPVFENEEPLRIFIDTTEMVKLHNKRLEAFQKGILETQDNDWVNGIVFWGDTVMRSKIRLKGDWLDHLEGKKWSFRIKLKREFSWKGMREFSVQTPLSRGFILGWLAQKLFDYVDVLSPRYGFVPVILNNRSLGVYAFEEHFVKQLVESRNRREGPILKLSETEFWYKQKLDIEDNVNYQTPYFEASCVEPFKGNRTISNPVLYNQFLSGQNLYWGYKNHLLDASEIFDLDAIAKFYAIIDVAKFYHGMIWHNQRQYFNPVTCKLEPIAFDGYIHKGVYEFFDIPIYGFSKFQQYDQTSTIRNNLFCDTTFVNKYILYLKKFSDEDFIHSFQEKYLPEINKYEKMISTEFEGYKFDYSFLYSNAQAIRDTLEEYKEFVDKNPDYVSKTRSKWETFVPSDTLVRDEYPAKHVKAFTEKKSTDSSILKIFNYNALDIILLGTGRNEKSITNFFNPEPVINSFNKNEGTTNSAVVISDTNAAFLYFIIDRKFKTYVSPIYPWQSPGITTPRLELMEENTFPESDIYEVLNGKKVVFKSGEYSSDKFIIIPKGYSVSFEKGFEIDLINGAGFISFSPVYFNGTKDNPVIIYSSDFSAMGFTVLKAGKTSSVNNTIFKGLNTLDYKGWTLTGAVNFYESDVKIINSQFIKNHCEDALNTIRSEFEVTECLFKNIFSDAFDSDFCTGKVFKTTFDSIGNDAIDFSGSKILIEKCFISNAKDKGISGGEASNITVINTKVESSNIGIASKDKTIVRVNNSEIFNCNYSIVAFQKKPEFGSAKIILSQCKLKGNKTQHLIEKASEAVINTIKINGSKENVAEIFY